MSNTRHAKPGSDLRDERFASDPLLSKGLKMGDVIRRCETLEAPEQIEVALFLQYISNLPGSLDKLVRDLLTEFPERIGSASMRKLRLKPGELMSADQASQALEGCEEEFALETYRRARTDENFSVKELFAICRDKFHAEASPLLRQFCLDPAFGIELLKLDTFQDLPGALLAYMDRWEKKTLDGLVVTEVGKKVLEALSYSEDQKCLALVEGFARTGKTFIAKAWCTARPGRRRIVSLSEASSEKEFFREIAKAVGAAASYGFKGNEIRERVNDILRPGYFTLVIDEAHFLWPQRNLREAAPRRIEWVRASLANYGTPVVMIATHQFTKAQQQIEKNTNWSSEQLIGRIAFCAKLPDHLQKEDIAAVARYHLPEAEERSIAVLVDSVIVSKKHLASVDHCVKAARHEAAKVGRATVTHRDILVGLNNTVLPSDRNLMNATLSPAKGARVASKRRSKVYALPISAPVPERDSGASVTVAPDRNKRSIAAILSTA